MPSKAVILLSGGLDSATVLAIAKSQGYELYALTFSYGQRHEVEVDLAKKIAEELQVKQHQIIHIDLKVFGGSSLTADINVPKDRNEDEMQHGIPITYVPARNTIFLSYALAYAEVLGADSIFIGVNAVDYSGYPDCRPDYIEAFNKVSALGTKRGVEGNPIKVITPIISLTKAQIISKGISLGIDYSKTHSCYDPDPYGKACGKCDSCVLRKQGFLKAGIPDPTIYSANEKS